MIVRSPPLVFGAGSAWFLRPQRTNDERRARAAARDEGHAAGPTDGQAAGPAEGM